jgi:hypothetical protein
MKEPRPVPSEPFLQRHVYGLRPHYSVHAYQYRPSGFHLGLDAVKCVSVDDFSIEQFKSVPTKLRKQFPVDRESFGL